MFNVKKLKANVKNDAYSFGQVIMPIDPNTLTASYNSADWRDSTRLTFFDLEARSSKPVLHEFGVNTARRS